MSLMTRNRTALLFALPALLVPVIEIPLVLWARSSFIALHPDYLNDPPTISRSINDPAVGGPFANLILVITALILMVTPVLVWSYAKAISQLTLSRARRAVMRVLLVLLLVLQIAASAGMVLTTQFTFAIDHDLHMLGSYIFFCFQALTIVIAGTLCRMLHGEQRRQGIPDDDWQFLPVMHRVRFRFAMVILALVVSYGILFVLKDHALPVSAYAVQVAYTQCEVIVIACYVLFLGSYGIDINNMVRRGKLSPGIAARPEPVTGAAAPPAREVVRE
ncbi:MAG: hypothetical protein U1E16_07530 [Hyphomicrobiales bacterium]|uniref:hypothetical protein n=1 Tax=Aestuariivirga sp. TaxID=2650926 RepID=UPI0035B3F9EB